MAPKRTTRSTPVTTTPAPTETTTTSVTNTQLQAMIDQGTEGVVELTQWFKRMETVFRISNCPVENQGDLRKKMTDKYCPRNEMKKLEAELWNLKVKSTDVIGYNQHFQKLALLCVRMFPEEFDKIERLRTKGSLKTLPETIKTNNNKTRGRTLAGLIQQGLVKRSHTGDLRPYALNATITTTVRVLQNATNATKLAILLVTVGVREMPTMLTIRGALGQARNLLASSVEFKDTSRGNHRAPAKVYMVGRAGTNPDSNIVTSTFLLNNRYASILFDTSADRIFVSTTFSSQIDITPSTLDHYYDVELANGRIIGLNTILRGCTLNLLNHPFNKNIMPVELGSFDIIIGMDWLAKYQAIIMYAEKIVRIPCGNETLIVHGDESNQGYC
ncbi:reverse transcriptase domain-containing protein [Tanacetum coccineum]